MAQKSNVGQPLVQASLIGEAIDGGPVAVLVADEEKRYFAVNSYACELLGYTREELLERTIGDVATGARAGKRFAQLLKSGAQSGRVPVRRKDGSTLVLEYRAAQTTIAGMTLYVSVAWPAEETPTARPQRARRSAPARG